MESKAFDSTFPRPSKHSCFTARPAFKPDYPFSSPYSRCDHLFHKNRFDKRPNQRDTFICQTHSSSWSGFNRPSLTPASSYRMAVRPQSTHLISNPFLSCRWRRFIPIIISLIWKCLSLFFLVKQEEENINVKPTQRRGDEKKKKTRIIMIK